jgi:proteasome lid subunit RPN8/RPN11
MTEPQRRIQLLSPVTPPVRREGPPPVFAPGAGLRQFRCTAEDRRPGDCDIVVLQSAYRRIVEHLQTDTVNEQGGLLFGYEIHSPDSTRTTVVVLNAQPGQFTEGSPTRLSFPEECWLEFERVEDQFRDLGLAPMRRVGWYHSHPNLGIFLSHWDLDVCSVFTRPTHLALVVDPVRDLAGFFVRGDEGFRQHSPQGFWELCDLRGETVVTWRNMEQVNPLPESEAPAGSNGRVAATEFNGAAEGPVEGAAPEPAVPSEPLRLDFWDRVQDRLPEDLGRVVTAVLLLAALVVGGLGFWSVKSRQNSLEQSVRERLDAGEQTVAERDRQLQELTRTVQALANEKAAADRAAAAERDQRAEADKALHKELDVLEENIGRIRQRLTPPR